MNQWLLLVISLPSRSATVRMRIWRALKGLGAGVLRDGVYLLPRTAPCRQAFAEQARAVLAAGGAAHVLPLEGLDPQQARQFCLLFDRSRHYADLLHAARKLSKRRPAVAAGRTLKRLQREYAALHAIDYFPGPAAEQVAQALAEAQTALAAPGEPQAQTGRIPRLDAKDFRGRTWATRARPWVDRLASAWLIQRFINPKARFVWLKKPDSSPRKAVGFDFDGATFTHVGARVTFEVLLASFGLEGDKGLERLGRLVHYLDVGGVPVAEAAGLEALLKGARATIGDDDKLLHEAGRIFEHLYHAYQGQ